MKCFHIFLIIVSAVLTGTLSQHPHHHHHHQRLTAGGGHQPAQSQQVRYVLTPQTSPGGHQSFQYSIVQTQQPQSQQQTQASARVSVTSTGSSELDAKKIHEQFVAAFQAQQRLAASSAPLPSNPSILHANAGSPVSTSRVPLAQQQQQVGPGPVVQYFVRQTPARVVSPYQQLGQYQITPNGVRSTGPEVHPQFLMNHGQRAQPQIPPSVILAQQQQQRVVAPIPTYTQQASVQPYPTFAQGGHGLVTHFPPQYAHVQGGAIRNTVEQVGLTKVKATSVQVEPSIGKIPAYAPNPTAAPSRPTDVVQYSPGYPPYNRPTLGLTQSVTFTGMDSGTRAGPEAILAFLRNGNFIASQSQGHTGIPSSPPQHPSAPQSVVVPQHSGQVTFSHIIPQQPTRVAVTSGSEEPGIVPKLENIQVYSQTPSYHNYQQQFQQLQQQQQQQQQQHHIQIQQQQLQEIPQSPITTQQQHPSLYTLRQSVPQVDPLSAFQVQQQQQQQSQQHPLSDNRIQAEVSAVSAAASAVGQSPYSSLGNSLQEFTSDILAGYNL